MISTQNVLLLLLYVGVSVSGLTIVKLGQGLTDYRTWLGAFLYGAGFLLWFVILMRFPLSRAFPVAAGSLIVGTQAAGWYVLKEGLPMWHLFGVALILAGIVVIFSQD